MIIESALFMLLTTSAINQPRNKRGKEVIEAVQERRELDVEILVTFTCEIPTASERTNRCRFFHITQQHKTSRRSAAPRRAVSGW